MADTYVIQPCLAFFRILGRMEFLEPMFWAMPTWRVTGTHASMFTLRWRTFRRSHKLQSYWGNKNPMQTVQKITTIYYRVVHQILKYNDVFVHPTLKLLYRQIIRVASITSNINEIYSLYFILLFFFFILWWSVLSISFSLPYLTCL